MKSKHTKLHEWQQKIKNGEYKCECCGLSITKNLTIDHIIPVMILKDLYADVAIEESDLIYNCEDNFQVLCKYCNIRKGCKIDIRNSKTIPLLKKIVSYLETKQEEINKNINK